mgnify:CR=1 FL=1
MPLPFATMGLGMGRMGAARTKGGGVPDLLQLFRSGEDGFLFYPTSDLTRLLLLNTGNTGNVAADADPVGLDLDNHSWGVGTSLTAILAAQPELVVGGSWTMSVAGGTSTATESPAGTLTLVPDGANSSRGDQSFATVVGKTYRVVSTVATSASAIQIGTTAGGTQNGTTTFNVGQNIIYFVATATTTFIRFIKTSAATSVISAISCKLVPGNHALQATTTMRPFWKANSGKPYLAPDGSDDRLITPFIPTAACTIAVSCRFPATDASGRVMLGGGTSTGNKRCYIGKNSTDGKTVVGWGTESLGVGFGSDLGIADHVILLTGDGTTRDLWVDGSLVDSRAPTGGPDGTGGGLAMGGYNNAGSPTTFSGGNLYAALALNRRVTPAEIALITSKFTGAYQ